MFRPFIGICLAILTLFLVMQPVLAAPQQPVAKVVWVKGSFKAGPRALLRQSPIYLHDVLITAANSQAEIVFTDNTLMTFKEHTRYSIDKYNFKKSTGSFVGTLTTGGFRTITGLVAKNNPGNYQVNTPVATIGVRGTDYEAVYTHGYLYVVVFSGTVCITPNNYSPLSTTLSTTPAECPCGLYALGNR